MTNFKKSVTIGAAAVAVAVSTFVFAQDDLDALIKGLDESGAAPAQPAVKPTDTAPAVPEPPAPPPAPEVKPDETAPAAAEAPVPEPEVKPEPVVEPTPAPVVETTPSPEVKQVESPDAELLSNVVATERLRRQAFEVQAKRLIGEARASMKEGDYETCASRYGQAIKLLTDREKTKDLRHECEQGVAEALYRNALDEWQVGRRTKAIELMEKAVNMRHPKARRQLDDWNAAAAEPEVVDVSDIAHRRNETEYQTLREKNRRHLRRSRQLLAVRDIDGALDECELVLVSDPYNEEALRLRGAIVKKRKSILHSEFEVTRDDMIAQVGEAWRPVYAPNARDIETVSGTTVKTPLGEDPERAAEQKIIKRMKEMRLPTIAFKPPATIIDAIDFFRVASKDFDRPDIPLEQRGFNFVLKTPEALTTQAPAAGDDNAFSDSGSEQAQAQPGVPVIPMITASDISFYDALKLVCDSVEYKFKVVGPIVTVMHKNMSIDEMMTRSYPVLSSFMERMDTASSDMKDMQAQGFGSASNRSKRDEGDDNQQRNWKEFFEMLGVQWPEGSSIMYIKTIGKLRVKNTSENLAELEKALTEMNAATKLVEIEARFVEVEQQDLNSLGFEWILNSDYSIGMDNWLGKAMNMKNGLFEGSQVETKTLTGYTTTTSTEGGTTISTVSPTYQSTISQQSTSGARWIRGALDKATMGVNAFGGTAADGSALTQYGNGNRYLSTTGNHISGEGKQTNDQFMRVNAFLGNADLSMILHMLSQRSDTDLLCAPKVLTCPGQEAIIRVVTEFIYPTDFNVQLQSSSSSSGGSYGGSQSAVLAVVEPESFTKRDVGVTLSATPTLTDDGNLIDLKLETEVVDEPTWKNYGMKIPFSGNSSLQSFEGIGEIFSSLSDVITALGGELSSATREYIIDSATTSAITAMDSLSSESSKNIQYYEAPMEQPFFHVRQIISNVSVYPGATIVMGGLITESRKAMDDKVPFLGDLPFVGRFFRSHAEQTTKRNLLVFVTTRLVDARGREITLNNGGETKAEVKPAPDTKDE